MPSAAPPEPSPWGGIVEADAGVLLMSGGTGIFAGPTWRNLHASLGYYHFDSPFAALGGVPEGFELRVNYIVAANLAWYFTATRADGPFVRAVFHLKQQRVLNLDDGARRALDSTLAGAELGWLVRVHEGLFLAPRVGALYYLASPQGPSNAPIAVGGRRYDNDRHKDVDAYYTLNVGYAF